MKKDLEQPQKSSYNTDSVDSHIYVESKREKPDWMIVCVDGSDSSVTQSAKTLAYCARLMEDIRPFKRAVLFANFVPRMSRFVYPLEIRCIPALTIDGYSLWMLRELGRHITTDYVLIVQADGYILNPSLWSEDFLKYDYIGAVWPHHPTFSVGNGGFSIRSRSLCKLTGSCPIPYAMEQEDAYICKLMRDKYKNIKFAPEEIARRFSVEHEFLNEDEVFGFHKFMGNYRRRPLP